MGALPAARVPDPSGRSGPMQARGSPGRFDTPFPHDTPRPGTRDDAGPPSPALRSGLVSPVARGAPPLSRPPSGPPAGRGDVPRNELRPNGQRVTEGGSGNARNRARAANDVRGMRRRAWYGRERATVKPGAEGGKIQFAREMRRKPTRGEGLLWTRLRERRLGGWKFRRQQVIAGYIVDFYCADLALAIEVDGAVHEAQQADDMRRDQDLGAEGVSVVRVRDGEVLARVDEVLQTIATACEDAARCARGKDHPGRRTRR